MADTLEEILRDMENGVYNFCKDGKCTGCGQCCSALLPVSSKEIKEIRRYVKKHHIRTCRHNILLMHQIDTLCPFLDEGKGREKCRIYPVRPKICRVFQCNQPPSKIRENRAAFWKNRKVVNMWDIDWND